MNSSETNKLEEGGPGSGYRNHPGNPGHVGGSIGGEDVRVTQPWIRDFIDSDRASLDMLKFESKDFSGTLYHGTSPDVADKIRQGGFKPAPIDDYGGGQYGPGVYFAEDRGEAAQYGSTVLQADVTGRFASLTNDEYAANAEALLAARGPVTADTNHNWGKVFENALFQARGFDGLIIRFPFGGQYVVDVHPSSTVHHIESQATSKTLYILFKMPKSMRESEMSLDPNLREAWRLIEAAEKAEALRAETTKNLSAVLKRVHSKHIFTIESMIGRYQHDLEKAAAEDKKPVARIAQLKALAQLYVPQAVAAGYQRGLSDLKTNGWVSKYKPVTPANAPQGVIQSILTDNEKYLTTSLLPDLQAGMSDKARIARMKLYGHFLWKAAERAYIQAILDFQTAVKARDRQDKVKESMVEGGAGSGNWDHVGRPGQRGGSGSTGDLNDKLRNVAQIYSDAKHDPTNPATQKAYAAFIKETLDQYHDLKAAGYKFDFEDKGEPYKDQPDMRRSVEQTKTLFVRSSKDDLPDDSPLAKVVEDGQTANTIFRGVHDMYGHYFPDNTFGERGEFKAYQAHGRMYSKDALPALAAETLAQNAWVNHSPENEGKPVSQRSFPDQKSFAFPVEIADEMRHSYFPELQNHRKYREGGVGSGNFGHNGRPGQRGGSAGGGSSIVPTIIARSIVRDGGITISTTGVRPRSGFAIAGIRNAKGDKVETIINGEAKPEDVQKFVNENKDILSQPNHYIGGWVNDGKTYLDVSEVQNDKATALDKAEARDEIAIYDLGTGEEHFTREDHLRPSESRAGRAA